MSGPNLEEQTFAHFEWEPRWNDNKGPVASVMHVEDYILAVGPMGTVWIKKQDIPALRKQLAAFDKLLAGEE